MKGELLSETLRNGIRYNRTKLLNLGEQLCKALCEMHESRPEPFYCLTLCPSRIFVTTGGRVKLSKLEMVRDDIEYIFRYAAPEQFGANVSEDLSSLIEERFKSLPTQRFIWKLDAKTDIYRLGAVLFEAATGCAPTMDNFNLLEQCLEEKASGIILKCLEVNPNMRYQTARELLEDIKKVRGMRIIKNRTAMGFVILNVGILTLVGAIDSKPVYVSAGSIESSGNFVKVVQRFIPGRDVRLYMGSQIREHIDGQTPEFVSPESIAVTDDGIIYLCDAGVLKRIEDGNSESISLGAPYLKADTVRASGNDVYVLTNEWSSGGEFFRSIIRINESGVESVFIDNATLMNITDFVVYDDNLYYILHNLTENTTQICVQSLSDAQFTSYEIPKGASAITADNNGLIYFSDIETGTISCFDGQGIVNFAGFGDKKAFVDGKQAQFFQPTRLHWHKDALYVWDFNTLRKVSLANGSISFVESVAGLVSKEFSMGNVSESKAEDFIWPNSKLTDFAITDTAYIVTDPKRSVIWAVK